MRRKIVVTRGSEGWTVGRDGQPFERFASKEDALSRARELIGRLEGEVELVVDGDGSSSPAARNERVKRPTGAAGEPRNGRRR